MEKELGYLDYAEGKGPITFIGVAISILIPFSVMANQFISVYISMGILLIVISPLCFKNFKTLRIDEFFFFAFTISWFVSSLYSIVPVRGIEFSIMLLGEFVLLLSLENYGGREKVSFFFTIFGIIHVASIYLNYFFPALFENICRIVLPANLYSRRLRFIATANGAGVPGLTSQTAWAAFFSSILCGIFYIKYVFQNNKLYLGVSLLSIAAIILTMKRGNLVGLVAAIVIISLLDRRQGKKISSFVKLICIGVVFVILILALAQYVPGIGDFLVKINLSERGSLNTLSTGRLHIYQRMIEGINPITFFMGNGNASTDSIIGIGGHNIYLQVLFENGIIGLIPFLSFVILRLISSIRAYKDNPNERYALSIFFQVLILVSGMTSNPLYDMPMFIVYIYYASLSFPKYNKNY